MKTAMKQWAKKCMSRKWRIIIYSVVALSVLVGAGSALYYRAIHSSEALTVRLNSLHDEAVSDLAQGDVSAATSVYDDVIAHSGGSEKARYLSERADVLFAYAPDKAKGQIRSDAYAAEKLNPSASSAYFIYEIETYYRDATAASAYFELYQGRLDSNAKTE